MRTAEFHPPIEEYLEAIESLSEEGTAVIQARLAEPLGQAAPSVSEMLDRLVADGYVTRDRHAISMTVKGREVAQSVIRKHRLAECLLVDIIGLPWYLVHAEAGRWEHVISDEVEERLVILLGDPGACPHGNPIPGSAHEPARGAQMTLAEVDAGQTVLLVRLDEGVELDTSALRYLDAAGFIPGRTATVRTKAPDGTLMLEVAGADLALGPDLCHKLFVTKA